MSPKVDLSNYLNDEQVCAQLGISKRTLDRQVKNRQLHPLTRPRTGMRPERVFSPDEVAAKVQRAPSVAIPAEKQLAPVAPRMAELAQPREITWAAIGKFMKEYVAEMIPGGGKLFVDLDAAAAITGLHRDRIRQLVELGKLDAIKGRKIVVRRGALDDPDLYRPLLMKVGKAKKLVGGKR